MTEVIKGYCMSCRDKENLSEMKDVEIGVNEKGTRTAKGVCAKCGTKMFKFLKKEA